MLTLWWFDVRAVEQIERARQRAAAANARVKERLEQLGEAPGKGECDSAARGKASGDTTQAAGEGPSPPWGKPLVEVVAQSCAAAAAPPLRPKSQPDPQPQIVDLDPSPNPLADPSPNPSHQPSPDPPPELTASAASSQQHVAVAQAAIVSPVRPWTRRGFCLFAEGRDGHRNVPSHWLGPLVVGAEDIRGIMDAAALYSATLAKSSRRTVKSQHGVDHHWNVLLRR